MSKRSLSVTLAGLCLVVLSSCRSQPSSAPPPAWPEETPPEYPGVEPSGSSAPNGASAEAERAASLGGESRSPFSRTHSSRASLRELSGKATYYSDSLAGNKTASGETYRPEQFSAAHRTLPFGTIVRVTRTDSHQVTYVKINDRGPFGNRDRIIDLSRAAASELGMLRAGVVPVRLDVLEFPKSAAKN